MANPTAEEQFLLELINEARLNPLANAARYISSYSPLTSSDGDIQTALTYFGVSGTALQSAYAALTAVNATSAEYRIRFISEVLSSTPSKNS